MGPRCCIGDGADGDRVSIPITIQDSVANRNPSHAASQPPGRRRRRVPAERRPRYLRSHCPVTPSHLNAVLARNVPVAASARGIGIRGGSGHDFGNGGGDRSHCGDEGKVDSTDLTLYRDGHRKHFQQGDCVGAMAAYERYIAEVPKGRFVLEASYNRALCLARLGRTGEAAAALRPFAEGRYGTYRRQEAQRIIEAMQGRHIDKEPDK